MQPGKAMSDSRLLDGIQEKLIRLIKNQGADGIISSELSKRFFDVYSERLELTDEAGEKFRIKDLLLSHPCITVSMHKGTQPKYFYDEAKSNPPPVEVESAPTPSIATVPHINPLVNSSLVTSGASYSAIVNHSNIINSAGSSPRAALNTLENSTDGIVARARRRGPSTFCKEQLQIMTIRCCICGIFIEPNDVAMCIECIRKESSIGDLISGLEIDKGSIQSGKTPTSTNTNLTEVIQCSKCDRWLQGKSGSARSGTAGGSGSSTWMAFEPESSGLLHYFLRQFVPIMQAKLDDFKMLDASFIWTEPHSRRIKVSVIYQRSVLNQKVTLQEKCTKEFAIKSKQCSDCIREASDHTWGALIQIRFRNCGKKKNTSGLIGQLEQLLLTGSVRDSSSSAKTARAFPVPVQDIQMMKDGTDIYFQDKSQAEKAAEIISSQLPVVRTKVSTKVISQDRTSNTTKLEYTICMEGVSLCKDDLVLLTPSSSSAGASQHLYLVTKISSCIHLLPCSAGETHTARRDLLVIPPSKLLQHYQSPVVLSMDSLAQFVVLDMNHYHSNSSGGRKKAAASIEAEGSTVMGDEKSVPGEICLVEIEVVRERELGQPDSSVIVWSHLGNVLHPGDVVLGYDLAHTVIDDDALSVLSNNLPEIVLTKKSHHVDVEEFDTLTAVAEEAVKAPEKGAKKKIQKPKGPATVSER